MHTTLLLAVLKRLQNLTHEFQYCSLGMIEFGKQEMYRHNINKNKKLWKILIIRNYQLSLTFNKFS